jgi:Domain of unknown function (DUF4331)
MQITHPSRDATPEPVGSSPPNAERRTPSAERRAPGVPPSAESSRIRSWLAARIASHRALLPAGFLIAVGLAVAGTVAASDHQDTAEVELYQQMDINDVYAFPSPGDENRIALVLTTASPLTPAQSGTTVFDPNLLYQIKVDNTGDFVEDLVFQITFQGSGTDQQVTVRGPVAPNEIGMRNTLVTDGPTVEGAINTNLGAAAGTQVFAGVTDDPFWIDLEQFFRIIPDRKPVSGVLSDLPDTPTATAFRDPGVDFLAGLNALSIVIELPEGALTGDGVNPRLGVWATISR